MAELRVPRFRFRLSRLPGSRYTIKWRPCPKPTRRCYVQFTIRDGAPHLRFCTEQGKPGHLLPVRDANEAVRKSREVCACWEQTRDFARCTPGGTPLGRARPRRRRSR